MKGEINLLPAHLVRERVRGLYLARGRQLLRVALALASLIVVGQLGVLAFYFSLARAGDVEQTAGSAAGRDVRREVEETNHLLAAMQAQVEEQIVWSARLGEVLAAVTRPLKVNELRVEKPAEALILRGISPSSSAVTSLQQALENLSWVQRVEAPLTNYAVKPDAAFSLTVVSK